MADYQTPPEQNHDPAGSTQMFRAFVDEGAAPARQRPAAGAPATTYGSSNRGGSRTGLIVAVVAAIVIVAAIVYAIA
ncbi:hypothetical protein K7472_18625 [Streptomyces sp. PTM05]|uniref:SPOR domain-containing protein n=1 Tax=Streptantibioticus parmotrematis TaxID=2873249 RepID=A0ABS7QYK1_9ACTN|nr:hypothetical protein [Streptantibioticus parmotrematis]MBY8886862.1 hypothetical protein [Streptantibioticus parmotrematis]